jgi:hypothetical protein
MPEVRQQRHRRTINHDTMNTLSIWLMVADDVATQPGALVNQTSKSHPRASLVSIQSRLSLLRRFGELRSKSDLYFFASASDKCPGYIYISTLARAKSILVLVGAYFQRHRRLRLVPLAVTSHTAFLPENSSNLICSLDTVIVPPPYG